MTFEAHTEGDFQEKVVVLVMIKSLYLLSSQPTPDPKHRGFNTNVPWHIPRSHPVTSHSVCQGVRGFPHTPVCRQRNSLGLGEWGSRAVTAGFSASADFPSSPPWRLQTRHRSPPQNHSLECRGSLLGKRGSLCQQERKSSVDAPWAQRARSPIRSPPWVWGCR